MKQKGFTLAEIMVTLVLFMLMVSMLFGFDYVRQIKKAQQSKLKHDLSEFKNIMEEYYADNRRYPEVADMTYEILADTPLAGKMCGPKETPDFIKEYMHELPCHYESPTTDFVYFSWASGQEYAVFTSIEIALEPGVSDTCPYGCSYFTNEEFPKQSVSTTMFNYYVSSTSKSLGCSNQDQLVGCYPHKANKCASCQHGVCEDTSFESLYCNNAWCQDNCK